MQQLDESRYYSRDVNWDRTSPSQHWSEEVKSPSHRLHLERVEIELYDLLTKAADASSWGNCRAASDELKREAGAVLSGLTQRHIIPPYPRLAWNGLIRIDALRSEAVSLMLDCAEKAKELGKLDIRDRLYDLIEADDRYTPKKKDSSSTAGGGSGHSENVAQAAPAKEVLVKKENGAQSGRHQSFAGRLLASFSSMKSIVSGLSTALRTHLQRLWQY